MAAMTLSRPHDPFSGHVEPSVADETTEPPAPVVVPIPAELATKKAAVRKVRRPRRVPTAAEMDAARAKVTRR